MPTGEGKTDMRKLLTTLALAALVVVVGPRAYAAITPPAGTIPTGLPARMTVGLFENGGETWMRDSAVPWDVRYAYFVKGWVDNWGWGARDGSFALNYFRECDTQKFIPAVQYYQMNGEPGGGESAFYSKTQNASTMAAYFNDFKIFLQRAKEFGKPVVVLMEADGYGYMQQQTNSNPNAYSAVAASGLPELAGLPNTAAGWSLAFLQLRKAVGANNVVLGMHISGWASGKDILYYSVTDPLQPEVDKVYNFLAPGGLTTNVTGATYDFLVADPLDRDSDFYRLTLNANNWWDASDSAAINTKSFNRFAEYLRLWNVKSSKRWVLWQIPLGNSNHLNVYNNGGSRQGYKDNRPEYFFGANSLAHLEKMASSGVISLLFGAGAGGQSSYQNDTYTDGQLFMKSRAGNFLKAGGLAIPSGGTTTTPPPTTPPPSSGDTAVYNFESNVQGWTKGTAPTVAVSIAGAQKFAGNSSLSVQINGSGTATASVANPTARAGQTVTFRLFIPTGARISWVQPYVLQGAAGNWAWTGNWQPIANVGTGSWKALTVQVPSNAQALSSLGIQFGTDGSFAGSVYVDSVTF